MYIVYAWCRNIGRNLNWYCVYDIRSMFAKWMLPTHVYVVILLAYMEAIIFSRMNKISMELWCGTVEPLFTYATKRAKCLGFLWVLQTDGHSCKVRGCKWVRETGTSIPMMQCHYNCLCAAEFKQWDKAWKWCCLCVCVYVYVYVFVCTRCMQTCILHEYFDVLVWYCSDPSSRAV
jgi:hypothetical protein